MSGRTRSKCPDCGTAYAPRARSCAQCGRKRDQKTLAEVEAEHALASERRHAQDGKSGRRMVMVGPPRSPLRTRLINVAAVIVLILMALVWLAPFFFSGHSSRHAAVQKETQ